MYWLLFAPFKRARVWTWNRILRDWNKVKSGEWSLWWYWKYYFLPRSWWWYESLFSPTATQICGEATPRYATLGEKRIRQIKRRLPNLKIIYLLRNPIERMWSDAAMQFTPRFGSNGIEKTSQEELLEFLKSPENLAHSKFYENLTRWEECFGKESVFIGFQDQYIEDPEAFMKKLLSFLGVSGDFALPADLLCRKINQNRYPCVPAEIEHMLAKILGEDVERLHKKIDNQYTAQWVSRM